MYYDHDKFKKLFNEKLIQNKINGGEATKEEIDNLYKYWLISPANSFKEFFNSFALMTIDEIDETFEIDYDIWEVLTISEIIEYLNKETNDIAGGFQLSDDLWLIIA